MSAKSVLHMQTKNTDKVSNGDLGFIRYVEDTPEGKRIGLDFGEGRSLEYSTEDLVNLDLAYATTIHKAMGSEYDIVLMPVVRHSTMIRAVRPKGRNKNTGSPVATARMPASITFLARNMPPKNVPVSTKFGGMI